MDSKKKETLPPKPLYTITTTSYILGKIPKEDIESADVKDNKQEMKKIRKIEESPS